MVEGKTCTRCKTYKLFSGFAVNSKGRYGYKSVCKSCSNKGQRSLTKRRREEDPVKWSQYRRDKLLKSAYGITQKDFDKMLEAQSGRCAVCGTAENQVTNVMFVDHCHSTGKVRGLLCSLCNSGIGKLQDDPEVVLKAYKYLLKYKD